VASRLSTIPREQLPEDQRRFHDAVKAIRRRPISGPFIVLLNSSPDLAARFAHLGHYFHARGQADESILSLRVRTFTALIGSRALDAPYEWSAWVGWAVDAGVPQETVDAIRERRAPQDLTVEDALVLDFCTQLLTGNHRVRDATCKTALDHFGVQGLVELVVTLGYFAMIAFPLNAFEMEMSAEQKGMRKSFEPLRIGAHAEQPSSRGSAAVSAHARRDGASARIPRVIKHADMPPAAQHYFDRIIRTRGRVSGPFQVLLNSPDVADRVATVGDFLLFHAVLPPPVKTLSWLVSAREFDCDYEWAVASSHAQKAGIDDALIHAIRDRQPLPGLSEEQRILVDFCHQLLRGNHHVSEATYRAAVERFGVGATVQIAATVGYFAMLALLLNAFEVDPQPGESEPSL
jgi:4-carboxymuconolactone decarboxylase